MGNDTLHFEEQGSERTSAPVYYGDLYFISCHDYVKIGRTVDVWKRMQNMQSNTPFPIDCLARLVGRGFEEPVWHAAFCEDRQQGEWFLRTPALERAIAVARDNGPWWDSSLPPMDYLARQGVDESDNDQYFEAVIDWQIALQIGVKAAADRKPRYVIDAERLLAAFHAPRPAQPLPPPSEDSV
jgi:hypothetical protein